MLDFIYQIEKEEKDNEIELKIYHLKNKQTSIEKKSILYQILTKKKDFEKLNIKTENIIISNQKFFNKKLEEVLKIQFKSKELYEYVNSLLKDENCETYESDILAEHRFLIDENIPISKNKKIPKLEDFKTIALDIETIPESEDKQKIVMIAIYSENKKESKVYTYKDCLKEKNIFENKNNEKFNIEILENEKEILIKLKEDILKIKAQIIMGWNLIDFDFKIIKERFDLYNIEFNFSNEEGKCNLRINKDFFKDSSLICSGVLILDLIPLLKQNYIVFEDYKLNTVAKEVLSDEKIDLSLEEDENEEEDKINAIINMLEKNPLKLAEYNFKDVELTYKIAKKLKLIELMCSRSIITGTPFIKVKSPIAALDIMYLKELHKLGFVANSNYNYNNNNPIEGAFVIEPKRGFYTDIFVLDFKSLYPSIIMTFNIDPFSINDKGTIIAPNGAKFLKEKAILPKLIEELYELRDIAKKENDSIKSYTLKITMNSFYGAMASAKSRFHNRDVGGAITSFGRFILNKAKEFAEDKGYDVIYGDTDSVFIKIPNLEHKSMEDKKKQGFELEKAFNEYFSLWVKTEFSVKSYLKIEFEKIFSSFFIASKKRYVGYDEFSKKIMFTGMEAIRGDWTILAQNFQKELVNLIFAKESKENIQKFILSYINKLKNGEFDDLLIYKKKITKELHLYTKMTPPHVKAARELKNFKGRIVEYVLTKDGPKHISLINENTKYDYEHYIEKQLKGVSDDLLEALGIDFQNNLDNCKQKSLDKFF